ncbi:hypothetical protein VTN96DRAFT_278 [Rasamsonia emersonii]
MPAAHHRLTPLLPSELSPEQKALYEDVQQARLPPNVREVAILTLAAHFSAAYERYAHTTLAEPVLGAAKVAALSAGRRPPDLSAEEACAFDIAKGLMQGGPLPESLYSSAVRFFGPHGARELIFLIAFYGLVSVVLNGFDVQVPETATSITENKL